jgi:hypothetical protein
MSRSGSSGFGAKEARVKPSREQVNLCGSCGTEISATELLCKGCRGTMGRVPSIFDEESVDSVFSENVWTA